MLKLSSIPMGTASNKAPVKADMKTVKIGNPIKNPITEATAKKEKLPIKVF